MGMGGAEQRIREHIETIARRDSSDFSLLADALHSVSWPDGGMDRKRTDADAWFRRFMCRGESGPSPVPASCGCASGRCLVCN